MQWWRWGLWHTRTHCKCWAWLLLERIIYSLKCDANLMKEIMTATIQIERQTAELNSEVGMWAVFQGRNLVRFIISGWPKITQQFVGLTVFNTFAVYFCKYWTIRGESLIRISNKFHSPICRKQEPIPGYCHTLLCTATVYDPYSHPHWSIWSSTPNCIPICGDCLICFMSGNCRLFWLHHESYRLAPGELIEIHCQDIPPGIETIHTYILKIFFACLATFSTTGASAIGYAYAAEIAQQRLRAKTAAWSLATSNLFGIMFSFCTPLMINGPDKKSGWGVKTGFLWVILPFIPSAFEGEF